uniref:Translocator protein homolog n=1 Tax=Kalanchoe fedtschenkoi TaxID=63787 RepID=A0A7N0ZRL4_KALFE
MASSSSNLRQRAKQPNPTSEPAPQPNPASPKPHRAVKSLTFSVLVPLTLTSASIWFFGSSVKTYNSLAAASLYLPPLWFIHLAELASSALMGFAAWFVWVDGGFRRSASGDAAALYVSHVALCLTWDPLVLRIGAAPVGFVFCVVNFGTVVAVYGEFRRVNGVAGQLVRPCMAWMALLTLVTFKLIDVSKVVDLSEMRLYD